MQFSILIKRDRNWKQYAHQRAEGTLVKKIAESARGLLDKFVTDKSVFLLLSQLHYTMPIA